ncbi:phage holin family protein [Xanthovirga aplysinae]|uniref:phage holin family protein n=1 Tax=Xanthovirga aplysinae TaxID=2529853 RepID=UPI0012BBC6D8|nr:phage holin family protein [Xanthovirga aplysinae]MTI32648.1 hypothetical protein [Xanthovirga aplysinae]
MDKKRKLIDLLNVDELLKPLMGLIEAKIELSLLDIEERAIDILAKLLSFLIMGALLTNVLIFGSFALGYFLNDLLSSNYLGFLIITGFYLLIFIVLYLIRKKAAFKDLIFKALTKPNHQSNEKRKS